MNRRRRKKQESAVKSVFLILVAAVVMVAAIYIVVNVIGKIRSDYESLEFTREEETTAIDIEVEDEKELGWHETDEGWKYLLKKDEYATDRWLEIEGFLYYFGEDSYMVTGELKEAGQIFTLHETKGYLQDIQKDWDYVSESAGETMDSLVRTNAFLCYLQEQEEGSASPFKVIQYRKTVEDKVKPLGNDSNPEKTTRNSMSVYGDYLYFLPKVKDSQMPLLSQDEQQLCNKLFRIIPGSDTKELIADNVDGFMVLDHVIYYAQGGKIYTAVSGIEYATGDDRYSVVIKDDGCYLVDQGGMPAVPQEGRNITIGDRSYQLENDGKITFIEKAREIREGRTYYMAGSGSSSSISYKTETEDKSLIKETFGVQSYCIVDKEIYYCAYVDKDENGQWYSQVFKTNLLGENKEKISERFLGTIGVMYYFEDEGEIYGEYYPAIWEQAYGEAVVITAGGGIYRIEDQEVRTGKSVSGNDRLGIVMAKDGKLAALWQDRSWSRSAGITQTLWSQAVELDTARRRLLETEEEEEQPETTAERGETEEEVIIRPLESAPSSAPAETAAPVPPSVNRDPVISTDGPHQETTVSAPVKPEDEVEIIPLG